MPEDPEHPLKVEIIDGRLVISIALDTLKWAAEHMEANNTYDEAANDYKQLFSVTDLPEFGNDVRRALTEEGEDGSTKLTALLDAACLAAIEDGSAGVRETK